MTVGEYRRKTRPLGGGWRTCSSDMMASPEPTAVSFSVYTSTAIVCVTSAGSARSAMRLCSVALAVSPSTPVSTASCTAARKSGPAAAW